MKKYLSSFRGTASLGNMRALLPWLSVAALVPLLLWLTKALSTESFLAISISWIAAVVVAGASWRMAFRLREEELRSSVSLYLDLIPPEESRYADSFQIEYENRGSRELEAVITLYTYPSTRGRNEAWNPAFRDDFRDEIMSLGPFETHELILSPGERETYPYTNPVVLQAAGLHGYIPHWITFQVRAWPRGMPKLVQRHSVFFYLLWFCGEEQRFPGTWFVDRVRIKGERHHSRRATSEKWKQQLADVVPEDFKHENMQDFIDRRCR